MKREERDRDIYGRYDGRTATARALAAEFDVTVTRIFQIVAAQRRRLNKPKSRGGRPAVASVPKGVGEKWASGQITGREAAKACNVSENYVPVLMGRHGFTRQAREAGVRPKAKAAAEMRARGDDYGDIAKALGLSASTVRHYCWAWNSGRPASGNERRADKPQF